MAKTRNKEAHKALLRQYIKEIENPDMHGFIGGKWVQSPYKGDDPNNRGYGVDILNNKAAAKIVKDRPDKWLSEDEERMLRNKHIKDVNKIVNDHYFPYLRRTPLTEEKEIMATGLLYRGDHINGTKLADPYYNGSNTDFQKAVEDYYRSKNLNDRAWRSKEFMDTHKASDALAPISFDSPYVPMEHVGYHPNEDYYYAGELPQVDAYGEHSHAEGGMLYGNEEQMPNAPQEEYQDEYQNNAQESPQEAPRQWDELSLSEKNAFIASAVKHGITSMEDIRKAYNELSQGQMNVAPEEMEEDGNKFLKGGYKPSRSIRNYIANKEGASMKTNRSFEEEAQSFWNVLPKEVRSRLTREQADALYSYSYNVGAGNFKHRVVPALQRYFNGIGSMEDVQRHMYATKDSQLRGLANRRAEERAMFAGSKVPVYYDAPNDTPKNAPNVSMGNIWRSSRLGPVNSINVSRGLGVVNNNGFNNNALLGPVNNIRQDTSMMSEAINTLYDDANPTLMEVPQEEQSSLDRYNAIQDYLSSLSPFGYARGGRMYKDGGVTSSNGQYHVEPSEYSEVLDSAANGNPLEVTLPDTTVTAADPRNYRSYYDPDGAGEFMDATTLGLFPNPFNLSRSASTFMQKPSWGSAWDTTKDALMLAGSTGKEAAFAPLGIMNLMDKDGVRKTYGLAKDGNYAGAVISGLGDALNVGMVLSFLPPRNKAKEIKSPVLQDFGSTGNGSSKFNGFIEDPLQMHLKRAKVKGYDTSGINIYNLSESTPENEELINDLSHQYGLSPKETLDFLLKHLDTHGHGATFKGTKIIIHDGKSPNQSAINSHEVDHLLHTPKEPLPDNVFYPRIKNIHGDYFIKDNNTEVAARGSQLRDYFGHTGKEPLTKEDLLYARNNYSKDTGIDNEMSEMLWSTRDFDTLADWMSKYSTGVIPLGLMGINQTKK